MANKPDTLGDSMKEFEMAFAGQRAMKGIPLMARLDGRAFHTFTKGLARPYDQRLSDCMIDTTKFLVEETGALIGYTQSDEITLSWFVDVDSTSEYMFGGRIQKMVSVLAGLASSKFMKLVMERIPEKADSVPIFDCRVWQVPNLQVASDAYLWRELDASKNSVSMAAHSYFGHKSLHGKTGKEKQEMLFNSFGINWNDYPAFFKRGTYVKRVTSEQPLSMAEEDWLKIPEKHRPAKDQLFLRTSVEVIDLPKAKSIKNYRDVLFFNQEPIQIN